MAHESSHTSALNPSQPPEPPPETPPPIPSAASPRAHRDIGRHPLLRSIASRRQSLPQPLASPAAASRQTPPHRHRPASVTPQVTNPQAAAGDHGRHPYSARDIP